MDTIDIITFTESQFAALTRGQLQTVKTAQQKKDRLYKELREKLRREKHKLVKNGVFLSGIYEVLKERLTAECEREVELVRQCLLFYLRYSMKPSASTVTSVEYTVDYALSDEARLNIVRDYYDTQYQDPVERFEAFKLDGVAPQYLGELYAPLYTYYLTDAEKA
jgi:hypothetical protein